MAAKDELCGHAAEEFWLLAFVTMATTCYASARAPGLTK